MNLLFVFFTGITIGISGAMIPGPLTFFVVKEVLKTNKFASLRIILGHIILEFVIISIIFLGFQRFLGSRQFLLAISLIGGIALIVMGIIIFLTAGKMSLPIKGVNSGFSKGLIIGGIFFSIISPGFIAWWATIGLSTVMRALLFGFLGVVVLTLGHWLADVLWYLFFSYAIEKSRQYLSNRTYQNIMRLVSIVLVILGIRFLIV